MNISLADKLKELRKSKKVSQEKLAEYLGVSYQAVSKWENGVTSPDVLLLPDIARYYGITVDELLQVERIDADRYIEECNSRAEKLYRDGKRVEIIPLWREAYKKLPNDIRVKAMLMSIYFDTDKVKYQNEIIELGTEIYNANAAEGGNSFCQGQAIQQIARTYYENGNSEKADEWARKAHQIIHCQELLYMQISDNIEALKKLFSFSNYCFLETLFWMTQRLGVINNTSNLGKDYAKNIYLTVTKMFELAFPNDDMSFEFLRCLCGLHQNNAEYEIFSSNDEALVKNHITRAIECAIKSVNINGKNLSVKESDVGFDLDGDGALNSTVALTIEYDLEAHPETNGYYGTYLDLYMAEFTENLQWYLDNLDYSEGWTWFDEDGNALSNDAVAAMTSADKAQAFIEGRYTKSSSGGMGGGPGGIPGGNMGELPDGELPGDMGELPNGEAPGGGFDSLTGDTDTTTGELGELPSGDVPSGVPGDLPNGEKPGDLPDGELPDGAPGGMEVGTPDGGTTQSNTGSGDSANYETYDDMVAAYKADIEEVYAGDEYGNNIVELYNPLNYIGADGTDNPTWTKIIMGASEGDISMFNSLNLQIAWLNAGVDAEIEWQWDGGHVPSEVLGESFSLYLDQMYGEYVDGAVSITKTESTKQTENGTSEEASGKDISSWVSLDDSSNVSFTLADIAAYRTAGASKAMPGFDVIDYGQEDYVFGSSEKDARHWNKTLLEIFEKYADVLEPLFNSTNN